MKLFALGFRPFLLHTILLSIFMCTGIQFSFCQNNPINIINKPVAGSFPLASPAGLATLIVDTNDAKVTSIAAEAFSKDIELLTGKKPVIAHELTGNQIPVIIGTLGKSGIIDQLTQKGLIPVNEIKGKWETFCIAVINNPFNTKTKALVITGSDPRGTAFGVFELSRMLGVSPFVWWADVSPEPKSNIYITPGKSIIGPPSVKYRGFFINDEDWGMQPWAARNMDTNLKDVGPNTYRKVFELMLRLKANYLWPAMHPCTKAFWYYKENPLAARDYAIIMGSSHHEPMLRDTEWEWNMNYKEEYGKDHGEWRYDTNKDEIYRFFDDRVKESVQNEAIYTVGMRATKDGGMNGPATVKDKVKILEDVITDQRQILTTRLQKDATQVPQVFCPYKEVLSLYQAGLKVPGDVTILWVDDNHGYIRQLSNPETQKRSGGSGVYYHFSYWGSPQDYLWLSSTSPVLAAYEMNKAYALNARQIWVFNVGDIKPAELELQFAMDMAWQINSWTPDKAYKYPETWAAATFGTAYAKEIAQIKNEYYRLAASGKPEHLNAISFTNEEVDRRLSDYQKLVTKTKALASRMSKRLQDAYFELIAYPVEAACGMNEKIFYAQQSMKLADFGQTSALTFAEKSNRAYKHIQELTYKYNTTISNGKWNGMMDDHPRDLPVFKMPKVATPEMIKTSFMDTLYSSVISTTLLASNHLKNNSRQNSPLKLIKGLGATGEGLTVWPVSVSSFNEQNITDAPYADYQLPVIKGNNNITLKCLPNFPLYPGMQLRVALSINGAPVSFINIATQAETKEWDANVLRGYTEAKTFYESTTNGKITLRVYFPDPGLVVNAVSISNK